MAAEQLKLPAADLVLKGTEVVSKSDPTKKAALGQIQAFGRRGLLVGIGYRGPNPPGKAINPFGAQFAEVEVNTKTGEIKVLRFLAAHDSGQVEHAVGAAGERGVDEGRIGEIAGDRAQARIGSGRRGDDVDDGDLFDGSHRASSVGQAATGKQCGRELAAEKSGAAGDDDAHGDSILGCSTAV